MLSVTLSVALANGLSLSDTWWAAISGFAVMQASFTGSVERAAHRIIGTLMGAALGTLVGACIGDRPWLLVPALGLIGGLTVDRASRSNAAYAWILGGVTTLMVTNEAHGLVSFPATASFAMLRVAEVAVGTLSCLLVASVFHFVPWWHKKGRAQLQDSDSGAEVDSASPPAITSKSPSNSVQPPRMLLPLDAALSISILASLSYFVQLPGFAQAMVTVIAVLFVPATVPSGSPQHPIMQKMVHRLVGCLLAGALGVALLHLLRGQAIPCILALSIGVWVGCHVQTGREEASYVGRQFTVAFIMVFVQDHGWSADPLPALMRLAGILTGIVVLATVMLTTGKVRFHSSAQG